MDKLIELLNEYEPYIQSDGTHTDNFWRYVSQGHSAVFPKEVGVDRIISKQYGFIKGLVDNDKIDFEKYRIMDTKKYLHQHIIGNTCYVDIRADIPNYEFILALLAIQDEPIEFLISILK